MPAELDENFSVSFNGPAFDHHEIAAAALAQSLLALDSLSKTCAKAVYGRDAGIEVKVQGAPRQGSFIVDLLIDHHLELAAGAGAVALLKAVVDLAKWAYGKAVKVVGDSGDRVSVENESSDVREFERKAFEIYALSKTRIDLSRLTQTLDREGAESISFSGGGSAPEVITRSDRRFFRCEEGDVLTDNESQLALEVITPRLNGSPEGWVFSEGEDGSEFNARVEDEEFLRAVREGTYTFKRGTSILALVRLLQVRKARTVSHRSIIQVLDVFNEE